MSRTRVPVVVGWFSGDGEDFMLLGTRCARCAVRGARCAVRFGLLPS
ncbi:hypothetical protein RKD18_001859 [Streptomyces phaeoluteigriseus]